jgi:hypothetical protein
MTKYCFRENLLLTAEDTTQILAYLHDGKPKLYHPGTISHATSISKLFCPSLTRLMRKGVANWGRICLRTSYSECRYTQIASPQTLHPGGYSQPDTNTNISISLI